jgi:hypothetical protein
MKTGFRTIVLACAFAALAIALATTSSVSASETAVNKLQLADQPGSAHAAASTHQGRLLPDRPPQEASRPTAEAAGTRSGVDDSARIPKRKVRRATFTFYNRNATRTQINFRFFSETRRGWVWPAGGKSWISPPNGKRYHVKLSCLKNEKVCFGGWAPKRPGYYWGVGKDGTKACSSCCYICNNNYASVRFVW